MLQLGFGQHDELVIWCEGTATGFSNRATIRLILSCLSAETWFAVVRGERIVTLGWEGEGYDDVKRFITGQGKA